MSPSLGCSPSHPSRHHPWERLRWASEGRVSCKCESNEARVVTESHSYGPRTA